jgi:NADH-quinone oxidoreductase subunit N
MTRTDFICLMPLIITAIAPVIIMLLITIRRNLALVYFTSLLMLAMAFISVFPAIEYAPHQISSILRIDKFSLLFMGIIFLSGFLITIISFEYLKSHAGDREEYFIMLYVGILGTLVLVSAEHFVTFFLGLETLSISLYVLVAWLKTKEESIEAGVKFLVIASLATAFLLFGMGLIYAMTGSMNFREIRQAAGIQLNSPLFLAGTGLMMAGIGFKLALVPFHMWTPDIYQGAPMPVTTFIATISKGAIMALALRFFIDIGGSENNVIVIILTIISVLSMFTGNLLALKQVSLKRMLAYSSIAHLGYLLMTILTGSAEGINAAIFYIIAYTITSLGAFGVLSAMSDGRKDADDINEVKGLFWSSPWLAGFLTIAFLSLAGIPLTAGFISKFFLVLSGVKSGLWLLAASLVINSVISLYYYLRVIRTMFSREEKRADIKINLTLWIVLGIIASGILLLGTMPSFLAELIARFSAMS